MTQFYVNNFYIILGEILGDNRALTDNARRWSDWKFLDCELKLL